MKELSPETRAAHVGLLAVLGLGVAITAFIAWTPGEPWPPLGKGTAATSVDAALRAAGAPRRTGQAPINIAAVIATVSHRVEPARSEARSLVSEDRLYRAEFTAPGSLEAPGYQNSPELAFDGTNYLVVWEDPRAGTDGGLYGARVSPAGDVLDPNGFPISSAPRDQAAPQVAFDGTNYLVVWHDGRAGPFRYDIYGARVSTAGTVLDPNGIRISSPESRELTPALAFDGTNYLVAWSDERGGNLRHARQPDRGCARPGRDQDRGRA